MTDEKTESKTAEQDETQEAGPRGGLRAADVASAEAYAKDGVYGAPGSEVDGARTPVTRDYSGDAENRPQTQIDGEQLGHDADEADPRLKDSSWLPGAGGQK